MTRTTRESAQIKSGPSPLWRRLIANILITFGFLTFLWDYAGNPARAENYRVGGYELGMAFEQFMEQPIPGEMNTAGATLKCYDDPKLKIHLDAVADIEFAQEPKAGAKTCTFLVSDPLSSKDSWKYFTPTFDGYAMRWHFTFLREQPLSGSYRLFKVDMLYKPLWEHRSDLIDKIRPALVQQFGAGIDPHRTLTRTIVRRSLQAQSPVPVYDQMTLPVNYAYDELVWNKPGQTVEFYEEPESTEAHKPFFCIGLIDEAMMVEYNRRLKAFGPQSWRVCQPFPGRDPTSHLLPVSTGTNP